MARRTYRLSDSQCAALLFLAGKPGGDPPRYHRTWRTLQRAGLIQRGTYAWRLTDEGVAVAERIAASHG